MSFFNLLTEKGLGEIAKKQTLLSATKDRKLWRVMIVHVLKGHGTWEHIEDMKLFLWEEKLTFSNNKLKIIFMTNQQSKYVFFIVIKMFFDIKKKL